MQLAKLPITRSNSRQRTGLSSVRVAAPTRDFSSVITSKCFQPLRRVCFPRHSRRWHRSLLPIPASSLRMPDVVQRRFIKRFFFILFLSPFKREGRRGRRGGAGKNRWRGGKRVWHLTVASMVERNQPEMVSVRKPTSIGSPLTCFVWMDRWYVYRKFGETRSKYNRKRERWSEMKLIGRWTIRSWSVFFFFFRLRYWLCFWWDRVKEFW